MSEHKDQETQYSELDTVPATPLAAAPHVHGPGCSHSHSGPSHDPFIRDHEKVGRNDPCPCGSLQKFKKCHGK
ncbi:MAG: hypothetical protein EOP10_20705 [Proteobacteria bacterium]|nr:MAG: hypothetical protein EOP10_20705 [Pseudomonadota bacterium]